MKKVFFREKEGKGQKAQALETKHERENRLVAKKANPLQRRAGAFCRSVGESFLV